MSNQTRVKPGVPTAGQFASAVREEPDVTLAPCAVREPEIVTEPAFRATDADREALAAHRQPILDAYAARGLDAAGFDAKAEAVDAGIRDLQLRLQQQPRRRRFLR